ncbi:unnamed protein product [Durusdinium trenchii]|uniref:Uncharacterized protein n=1 Tax=Durusdinium trenchii TaxID=1381693 RepID=A0ABP0LHA0_9DINO
MGGARTPLEPLAPESFWRSTLPNETLLRRLSIVSTEGARRRVSVESPWKQLTTRGMDESYALGRRIETWMSEQSLGDEEEEVPALVIASPDQRSTWTARAVLRGLCASHGQSDPMAVRLRTTRAALRVPVQDEDEDAKQDVAMDLTELLALRPDALEDASWPRLLDVAETASIFGLLPKGQLDQAWKAVLAPAHRAARALCDSKAAKRAGPLLRLTLEPAMLLQSGSLGSERLRLVVLPGFSLLCWACALQLPRLVRLWPAPSSSLLVETLDDQDGQIFLRIWHPRTHLELRPSWHQEDGPIPLERLQQEKLTRNPSTRAPRRTRADATRPKVTRGVKRGQELGLQEPLRGKTGASGASGVTVT